MTGPKLAPRRVGHRSAKKEVIRLTLPTGKVWTDIQVYSLDDGGSNGDEIGTLYWSSSAAPNLRNGSISFINFSHDGMGWYASTVEGSNFSFLVANGFDVSARYLFFRAGEYNGLAALPPEATVRRYFAPGEAAHEAASRDRPRSGELSPER